MGLPFSSLRSTWRSSCTLSLANSKWTLHFRKLESCCCVKRVDQTFPRLGAAELMDLSVRHLVSLSIRGGDVNHTAIGFRNDIRHELVQGRAEWEGRLHPEELYPDEAAHLVLRKDKAVGGGRVALHGRRW